MMKKLRSRIRSFRRRSEGVSALEYAILVGVIALAVGVAINTFSGQIADAIEAIGDRLDPAVMVPADGEAPAGDGDG